MELPSGDDLCCQAAVALTPLVARLGHHRRPRLLLLLLLLGALDGVPTVLVPLSTAQRPLQDGSMIPPFVSCGLAYVRLQALYTTMSRPGLDVLNLHSCVKQDGDSCRANTMICVFCAETGSLTNDLHHGAETVHPQRFVFVPGALL